MIFKIIIIKVNKFILYDLWLNDNVKLKLFYTFNAYPFFSSIYYDAIDIESIPNKNVS